MFAISKLVKMFLALPVWVALGMAASLALFRLRKAVRWVLGTTFLAYYLFSIWPGANFLIWSLEKMMPASQSRDDFKKPLAIVVLGGGATKSGKAPAELYESSWRRLWHGIDVYYGLGGRLPILFSGGSGDIFDPISSEASFAWEVAQRSGIPRKRFWIESASRNTFESALAIKRMLEERFGLQSRYQVVLVTSVWHMPRALRVLKRVGIDAIPEACDYNYELKKFHLLHLVPNYKAFAVSTLLMSEWVGLLGYKWTGRL